MPRETRFGNGTQVKPCRSELRTGWVRNREYRLKGLYDVLSFLVLLFCVLCGVIVKVTRPSFVFFFFGGGGYHPTLKLSGIPTFTFIVSLIHRTDNI